MSDITIKIRADGSAAAEEVKKLRAEFDRLGQSTKTAKDQMDKASKNTMERQFKRNSRASNVLTRTFYGLNRAAYAFSVILSALLLKKIHKTTVSFIVYENALSSVIGTTDGAAQAMEYLMGQSQRLGTDTLILAKSYTKFMAAGKESRASSEELHDMFEALAETGTVLQMSNQELEGAFRALTQMMSKGKVQAEELRGQLGEHLPGAFEIAAHSMGLTTRELDEMLKKGEITAEMLVKNLPKGLRDSYGASLPGAIKTSRAEFNRLHNDINFFLKDNKDQIDHVFTGLASALRRIWHSLKVSGVLNWLIDTNFGFTSLLELMGEIPKHIEEVNAKAKFYYDKTLIDIRHFQNRVRDMFMMEPMELIPKDKQDETLGYMDQMKLKFEVFKRLSKYLVDPFGIFGISEEAQDISKKNVFSSINLFKEEYSAAIDNISAKLESDLSRIQNKYKMTNFVGPKQPLFDTNSNSPVAPEALPKGTQKSVDSFNMMLAKMKGSYAEEIESYSQSVTDMTNLRNDAQAIELIGLENWYEAKKLLKLEHEENLFQIGKEYLEKEKEANEARITDEARGWSLSAKYAEQSMKFSKMTSYETTATVLDNFQSMASGLANESKSAFEANKAFSIAIAVMKGYESAISSYAAGARIGGPVLGASFAAVSVAFTARQIKAISEQSFGGGSSSPSSPSPTVQTPETTESNDSAGGQSGITIIIQGSIIGDDKVKDVMIDAIERAQFNDEIRIIGNGG